MKKLRLSARISLILLVGFGFPAWAGKFDLYFGAYDFSASTATKSGSKSGAGAYKITYQIPLFEKFEAGIGYTLILSDTFGGDAIFGLDLEGSYYPLTASRPLKNSTARSTTTYDSVWKPFVGFGYHARQFQSVSTQYNGFSVAVGTERNLNTSFDGKAMLRYGQFLGAREGEATEITALFGITFGF